MHENRNLVVRLEMAELHHFLCLTWHCVKLPLCLRFSGQPVIAWCSNVTKKFSLLLFVREGAKRFCVCCAEDAHLTSKLRRTLDDRQSVDIALSFLFRRVLSIALVLDLEEKAFCVN